MPRPTSPCRCCDAEPSPVNRRDFLRAASAGAALAATGASLPALSFAAPTPADKSESLVKQFYTSLSEKQRKAMCFAWDFQDPKRGLLRTHISNNWRITPQAIKGDFYTADQQVMIRSVWEGLVNPDWIERFDRQFKDDMGGFGVAQGVALFGNPESGPFEFVLSGRHGTVRCDGNSTAHVAFGGPILYGHAASGYFEKDNHPGNVFWHQAEAANNVYKMLDSKQREAALVQVLPDEAEIKFRDAKEKRPGIPVAELASDQQAHVQDVLKKLIEPFRQADRDEVVAALKNQGGLEKCSLAFYKTDDLGDDGIWDNWRLEGPAFVWHYRGAPHVHVWVNVADDPQIALNSKNLSGPLHPGDKK